MLELGYDMSIYGVFWVNVNNLAFYGYPLFYLHFFIWLITLLFYLLSSLFGLLIIFCFVTYFLKRQKICFVIYLSGNFSFWVLNSLMGLGKII